MQPEGLSASGQLTPWTSTGSEGDKNTAQNHRPPTSPLAAPLTTPRKPRILIVDDDPSVRETLADLLEIVGYCPLQAAAAPEALMILRQEPAVEALVTDLTMPGQDGIALIRHARELHHDLPAILLTGYAEQVSSYAEIAGGTIHVLRKPVESERLIAQLKLLMTKSREV